MSGAGGENAAARAGEGVGNGAALKDFDRSFLITGGLESFGAVSSGDW